MSEEVLNYLQGYDTEIVDAENISYPDSKYPDLHRLLVLSGDNILEMMEEEIGEQSSSLDYVNQHSDEVLQLTPAEAFRRSMTWLLELDSAELPASYQPLDKLSIGELYNLYRDMEQAEKPLPYLDEQIIKTDKTLPVPNADWVQQYEEDGVFWLTLPHDQEYLAPLIIPMGGFNESPLPVLQAVIFRYWQQQYHALPITVDQSAWFLRAGSLPQTDEQALQLAKEHVLFCPYVLESFDTIGAYASYLKQHDIWYFWWD